jgi:Flp pilus assembly protein TadD
LGEYDRAIDRYKTVLTTAPTDVRALNNLAYSIAVNKKDPMSALRLAERAYDISHNTTSELVLDVGYAVAARKGTPANVLPFAPVGYFVAAVKGQIADTVGWIHHLLGNDPEAIKFLTQAANGSPANAEVQFHVAVVNVGMGRLDMARAALERALELDPKLAEREDVKQLRARLPPG